MPASPEAIGLESCADTCRQTTCKLVYAGKQSALCFCSLDLAAALITSLDAGSAFHLQKNMLQECWSPALLDLCIHFVSVPFHLLPLWERGRLSHLLILPD